MLAMFKGRPLLGQPGPKGDKGDPGPKGDSGPSGGIPIGTIISYMGTQAPDSYLICDGAEYSITDYIDLASFFTRQFGGANYFGGVASFNGRTGTVLPAINDYTAAMVSFSPLAAGLTSDNVQGAIEELFQSVSDGKTLVASAITDKGVSTASDATFATMANNIQSIKAGDLPSGVYHVNAAASDSTMGEVTGSGVGSKGMIATCTARERDVKYLFTGWKEGNTAVSESRTYTFPIERDVSLIAGFEEPQYIAGVHWHSSANIPFYGDSMFYSSVAYGNGRFVAIGDEYSIWSTDGKNWTLGSKLPHGPEMYEKLTYADGKFFYVSGGYSTGGSYAYFIYSTDGETWIEESLDLNIEPVCATYANGLYILHDDTVDMVWSTDRKNWNACSTNTTFRYRFNDIVYAGGKFIACNGVQSNLNRIMYSEDGKEWTLLEIGDNAYMGRIAYGDGVFVSIGGATNTFMYSTDGINWNETTIPVLLSGGNWTDIAYGNGRFVAISKEYVNKSYETDKAMYSLDGINWFEIKMPSSSVWTGVAYGDKRFVAISLNEVKDEIQLGAYSYTGGKTE